MSSSESFSDSSESFSDSSESEDTFNTFLETGTFKGKRGKIKKTKKRVGDQKSTFIITINPNVSYKTLKTKEDRIKYIERFEKIINVVKGLFKDKTLLKKFHNNNICEDPVETFEYAIEMGKKTGFIHAHILLSLKCPAHIDQTNLRDLVCAWRGDNKKCHINIRFIYNPLDAVNQYINKEKIILASG